MYTRSWRRRWPHSISVIIYGLNMLPICPFHVHPPCKNGSMLQYMPDAPPSDIVVCTSTRLELCILGNLHSYIHQNKGHSIPGLEQGLMIHFMRKLVLRMRHLCAHNTVHTNAYHLKHVTKLPCLKRVHHVTHSHKRRSEIKWA